MCVREREKEREMCDVSGMLYRALQELSKPYCLASSL